MIRLRVFGLTALAVATVATASPALAQPASASTDGQAIAALFRGTAQVELREHFAGFALLYGLVGSNAANLRDAVNGEVNEHASLYPGFARQAVRDGCRSVAEMFDEAALDEGGHAARFIRALESLTDPAVRVPAPPEVSPVTITASRPACPGTVTQENLATAMHGEAFAYAKYLAYADQAARTRKAAIAALFRGTAQVELREHFAGFALLYGLVGSNAANLRDAVNGEVNEHASLYPGFARQAVRDGCRSVAEMFDEAALDEGDHAARFIRALESLTDPAVRVPAPPQVNPVTITASRPACPGTVTQENLATAMHGEAFAYAKYLAYADQAARS